MADQKRKVVGLTLPKQAIKRLEALVQTGLFGRSLADAMETIICRFLVENKKLID